MEQRTLSPEEIVKRMDAARKSHGELEKRVAALKGQSEAAKAQLAELATEAEREYGTSDLEELRALYQKWMTENVESLQSFESSLSALGQQVQALESATRATPST